MSTYLPGGIRGFIIEMTTPALDTTSFKDDWPWWNAGYHTPPQCDIHVVMGNPPMTLDFTGVVTQMSQEIPEEKKKSKKKEQTMPISAKQDHFTTILSSGQNGISAGATIGYERLRAAHPDRSRAGYAPFANGSMTVEPVTREGEPLRGTSTKSVLVDEAAFVYKEAYSSKFVDEIVSGLLAQSPIQSIWKPVVEQRLSTPLAYQHTFTSSPPSPPTHYTFDLTRDPYWQQEEQPQQQSREEKKTGGILSASPSSLSRPVREKASTTQQYKSIMRG